MYKRPEGQNLWGFDKSVVDFELTISGVVGLRRREPTSFQSFSGQSGSIFVPGRLTSATCPILKNRFGLRIVAQMELANEKASRDLDNHRGLTRFLNW